MDVPQNGVEGMIVTAGGRFGGYAIIWSKCGRSEDTTWEGGVGVTSRKALKMIAEVLPVNAGLPVAISYNTVSSEKISARASSSSPQASRIGEVGHRPRNGYTRSFVSTSLLLPEDNDAFSASYASGASI